MPITITEARYREACNGYEGWCKSCGKFTRDCGVEPDAENYNCPLCEENKVMGAEQALICGEIDIAEGSPSLCDVCNAPYSVENGCDCQCGDDVEDKS